MKTIIVDLDGTIANSDHRMHHVTSFVPDWEAFHSKTYFDTPYENVVDIVKMLYNNGYKVVICTARHESAKNDSLKWLEEKSGLGNIYEKKIYMRSNHDHRPADLVKTDLLKQMLLDGYQPVFALEDNVNVCRAFRALGITVLQVGECNY